MKTDSTSAALILSRKIRIVFWLVLGIFFMGSGPIQTREIQVNSQLLVTPGTLKNIPIKQRVIVDTRSKFKFLMGHIPGAINISNWRNFTSKQNGIKGFLIDDKNFISHFLGNAGLSPAQFVIIYGDPGNPWRTDGRFFWMFERYGFQNVAILDGGLDSWKESGGTLESGFQKERKPIYLDHKKINLNSEIIADKTLINKVFKNSSSHCLASRSR